MKNISNSLTLMVAFLCFGIYSSTAQTCTPTPPVCVPPGGEPAFVYSNNTNFQMRFNDTLGITEYQFTNGSASKILGINAFTGNLNFGTSGAMQVDVNRPAFQFSGDNDAGLYFVDNPENRYEFRSLTGAPVFWVNESNGSLTTNAQTTINGSLRFGSSGAMKIDANRPVFLFSGDEDAGLYFADTPDNRYEFRSLLGEPVFWINEFDGSATATGEFTAQNGLKAEGDLRVLNRAVIGNNSINVGATLKINTDNNSTRFYGIFNQYSTGNLSTAYAYYAQVFGDTTIGDRHAYRAVMQSQTYSDRYGFSAELSSAGSGDEYGFHANITGTLSSTGNRYGVFSNVSPVGADVAYAGYFTTSGVNNNGVYGENTTAGGYAGYFVGDVYVSSMLGVGVTTPNEALDVSGNVEAAKFLTLGGNGVINIGGSRNSAANVIGDSPNPIPFFATGDEDLWIADALEVIGEAYKTGGGNWTTVSDRRLKKNIMPYNDGLAQLSKINPVSYQYNEKAKIDDTESRYIGVIAQEMEEVAPYMVEEKQFFQQIMEDEEGNEVVVEEGEPYFVYDGSALVYMLVNSVKEQQAQIEDLKEELEEAVQNDNKRQSQIEELMNAIDNCCATSPKHNKEIEHDADNMNGAWLGQNVPNPFDNSSVIEYFIPVGIQNPVIHVTTMEGKLVAEYSLREGHGTLVLDKGTFGPGTYAYSLVLDGTVVESRKMMVH